MDVRAELRNIPPLGWFSLVVVLGLGALMWHAFDRDPEDSDWGNPHQPPLNVGSDVGGVPPGRPMDTGPAMRPRYWLSRTLADGPDSFIGEI